MSSVGEQIDNNRGSYSLTDTEGGIKATCPCGYSVTSPEYIAVIVSINGHMNGEGH